MTPIHYKARTFGETQISRFRDGWLLLKMVWFAYRKLKAIWVSSFRDGPKGPARNPYSRLVVMDSGLAASRRPGMTMLKAFAFHAMRTLPPR
jgi:hypothetical protein